MNPNDIYFDGMYKDIWRTLIPEDFTIRETEFLMKHFELGPTSQVLDLMCGYGRHSLALARKGVNLHSIDNLKEYTEEITKIAQAEDLPVHVVNANVLDHKFSQQFDLAICMGNSLNFFSGNDVRRLVESLPLKSGAALVINTWSLLEIACKEFVSKSWTEVDGVKFLSDSVFKFHPTRIETNTIMIDSASNVENKLAIDYLFSINELEEIFRESSFTLKGVYSVPAKRVFAFGDPRAYLIATKD
ncbi:MAG: class I SAM-dependent methyltransferase [Pedobacter sp.]|nr:MAG: class I SAM-dependent methyltransferase [Pedobacter sp.]